MDKKKISTDKAIVIYLFIYFTFNYNINEHITESVLYVTERVAPNCLSLWTQPTWNNTVLHDICLVGLLVSLDAVLQIIGMFGLSDVWQLVNL